MTSKEPEMLTPVSPEYNQCKTWNEFCFNVGGTPSTLQDIKVVSRCGGYSFSHPPNRFIYWTTNYDVLEMVEQSLDVNLSNNCVRYRFQDAPILDGITICEVDDEVAVLVPTVSSVHKLVFFHPNNDRFLDDSSVSIFSHASANSILDPTFYHVFNALPDLPHTAASMLTANRNAVFAFGMSDASVLLIRLENMTGVASTHYLKQESSVPRFLIGITDVFSRRAKCEDNVPVSLVLECIGGEEFLFALCQNGLIRVWSCAQQCLVTVYNVVSEDNLITIPTPGCRGRMLNKKKVSDSCMHLAVDIVSESGSTVYIVSPVISEETVKFKHETKLHCKMGMNIVDMVFDNEGKVGWCLIRSQETGEAIVSTMGVSSGNWVDGITERAIELEDGKCIEGGEGVSERYIRALFAPRAFANEDIAKVLSLYEGAPVASTQSKANLQFLVCQRLEKEIRTERTESGVDEMSDEQYYEICERVWRNFYTSCVQHKEARSIPIGLLWIPASRLLLVINKSGFTFYRQLDVIEEMFFKQNEVNLTESTWRILNVVRNIKLNEVQADAFNKSLNNYTALIDTLEKLAIEIGEDGDLQQAVHEFTTYTDSVPFMRRLLDYLLTPGAIYSCYDNENCESFRSDLGVAFLESTFYQLCRMRLIICRSILIFTKIFERDVVRIASLNDDIRMACHAYATLTWCCDTPVNEHPDMMSIIRRYLASDDAPMFPDVAHIVWANCEALWPLKDNGIAIAEYLLAIKEYTSLLEYAKLCKNPNWHSLLVEAHLQMGDIEKAYSFATMVMTPKNCLKLVLLFEAANQSEWLIHLANYAESKAEPEYEDRCRLNTLRFNHFMKLKDYDQAYVTVENHTDAKRRLDCLKELVVQLLESNQLKKLLSFTYTGLLAELEDILENRARLLHSKQAASCYSALYCLNVNREQFRKAAVIMFEQGFRSTDVNVQKECFAFCLDALYLTPEEEYAWVLKPTLKSDDEIEEGADCVEILGVKEVRREYELASARVRLGDCAANVPPQEVISRLISKKLFKTALRVASMCATALEPCFEAFAAACVNVGEERDPWSWLVGNEVADLVAGDMNASVIAWRLLEALLNHYEEDGSTRYHKAVCQKIASLDAALPFWLEKSYKMRNPTELLRLYVRLGAFENALKLACEYLDSGWRSKEKWKKCRQIYTPVNVLDLLLHELQSHRMSEKHEKLMKSLQIYMEKVNEWPQISAE